jgi:hypothetical protein
MLPRTRCRLLALWMTVAALPATAVTIQFDYRFDTQGFFSDPSRRAVLQAAGDFWSTVLTDSLNPIVASGLNSWTAMPFDPANPDATVSISNLEVAQDAVIVFAGGTTLLEPGELGVGGPGGFSASGFPSFLTNLRQRGQAGEVTGSSATDFAPWGGSVSFNSTFNWYFDNDVSTDEAFSGFDFYTVALHEVAHVLGFGLSPSWTNLLNGALFTGAMASAVNGGAVPISADQAHFDNSTQSEVFGVAQEALMDPDIAAGVRKRATLLDLAAMDDIGWEVDYPQPPAPEPVHLPLPAWTVAVLAVVVLRRAIA